jgi:integrase
VPALVDAATKTGNQRVVRLDAETVTAIGDLWSVSEWWGRGCSTPYDGPLNRERLTSWWGQARRNARIDVGLWLHDLRHWSATEAIGRGHDIRTVAGRLGHANSAMTLRTYAHALDGADAGVAVTLASALDADA